MDVDLVMKQRRWIPVLFLLSVAPCSWAGFGAEDPRLERLYGTFISPCCWRENLTTHDSPMANHLRAQIQELVRDGRSDEDIKAALIRDHTKRILSLPEGPQRLWLFWTPWLLASAGFAGLLLLTRRLKRPSDSTALAAFQPADLDDGWDAE